MNLNNDFYGAFLPAEEGPGLLTEKDRLEQAALPLIYWYQGNKRILPWREDPTPYHVWLSEIMLQQTRVEAVIPYYQRFLEHLPEIQDLAEVPDEELMKLWQGLGYYNRARNLKKAAQAAVAMYDGQLPGSYAELLDMPGIGPYTAGAVASIAMNLPEPAVDGNVLRVISRLWASEEDISKPSVRKKMEDMIRTLLIDHSGCPETAVKIFSSSDNPIRPNIFNQALMELGALICIPNGAPHCEACPWEGICLAHRKNLTDRIPYKAPKKARRIEKLTVLLIRYENQVFLRKRPAEGLLANLYELPNEEGWLTEKEAAAAAEEILLGSGLIRHSVSEKGTGDLLQIPDENQQLNEKTESHGYIAQVKPLKDGKHIFTHVEWQMKGYEILVKYAGQKLQHEEEANAYMVKEDSAVSDQRKGDFYEIPFIKEHLAIPSAFSCFPL